MEEEKKTKRTSKKTSTKTVEKVEETKVTPEETPAVETPADEAPVVETPVAQVETTPEVTPVTEIKSEPIVPFANENGKNPKLLAALGVVAVAVVVIIALLITNGGSKNVFKNTIKNTYKEVVKSAKEADKISKDFNPAQKAIYFNGDIKVEGKVDGEDIGSGKISWNAGISGKDKEVYAKLQAEGEDESVSVESLIEDGYTYVKTSLLDETIDLSDKISEDDLDMIFKALTETKEIKATDFTDVGQYVVDAVVKNLDEEKIEKDKAEIELGEKEVKVTQYSYSLSGKSAGKLLKGTVETLIDNDKFIEKTVDLVNEFIDEDEKISKKDFKDALKNIKESADEINIDEKISINIYTKGVLNKVVGYSISVDGKDYVSYVFDNKNFTITVDNHDEDDREKVVIEGVKEGKEWNVTLKYNKETLAKATVREFNNEKIDVDFEIIIDEEDKLKGSVYVSAKQKKSSISGEYKLTLSDGEENNINISGNYDVEAKDEIEESFNTDKAVKIDDIDTDNLAEKIEEVKEDKIIDALLGDILDELYDNVTDYDYYGMKDITASDVETVAAKKRAVLYVGKQYYSYYSQEDARNLLDYLLDAQDEYNFHSYYLSSYSGTEKELEKLNEGFINVCVGSGDEIIYDEEKEDEEGAEKVDTDKEDSDEENAETSGTTEKEKTEEKKEETDSEGETTTIDIEPAPTCDKVPAIYFIKDGEVVSILRGRVTYEDVESALEEIGITK